jgi:hypothetical protein
MIAELQRVILNIDLPEYNLVKGDIGIVVMVHDKGAGFEVEFIALDGETIAVSTLKSNMIRPVTHKEIAHVRNLKVA